MYLVDLFNLFALVLVGISVSILFVAIFLTTLSYITKQQFSIYLIFGANSSLNNEEKTCLEAFQVILNYKVRKITLKQGLQKLSVLLPYSKNELSFLLGEPFENR